MKPVGQLMRHIGRCIAAEKGKRIFYALGNILLIALAVLSVWGAIQAWGMMFHATFVGGLLLFILCIFAAIWLVIDGVIGQFILLVVNLIAMFAPSEERKYAISAFFIALLSIVAMIVAVVLLLL